MNKLKVVICGTSFGQFYIEAVKKLSEKIELVGILAMGSERSEKCAMYNHVPLFNSVKELPTDTDIACVVLRTSILGGKGTEIALELMERGINVIQEQPIHQKDVSQCLRVAKQKNLVYLVGNLYMHLPAINCFISSAKKIFLEQSPIYVDAAFASQVSYPMMQMLYDLLSGRTRPLVVDENIKETSAFSIMTGTLGKLPFIFRVHNEINPNEPDNYLHFLHRLTLGTEGGSLILEDTNASVLWIPRMHVPMNIDVLDKLQINCPENLNDSNLIWLRRSKPKPMKVVLLEEWVRAIMDDLLEMIEFIHNKQSFWRKAQEIISISGLWHEVTQKLGYARLNKNASYAYLNTHIFNEIISEYDEESNTDKRDVPKSGNLIKNATEVIDEKYSYLDGKQIHMFIEQLNSAIYDSILYFLQEKKVMSIPEQEYTLENIISALSAKQNEHIISRWLNNLQRCEIIEYKNGGYLSKRIIEEKGLKEKWNALRELWDWKLGSPLTLDYIIRNIEALPDLVTGKIAATSLLFPEGKMDYANSLYKETIISKYLNDLVAKIIDNYLLSWTKEINDNENFDLLEIGAGTGATTEKIISQLEKTGMINRIQYTFTDISQFFLGEAKEKYRDLENIKYKRFNLDCYPKEYVSKYNSADIIVAAGVLNNVRHIQNTLIGLLEILKPKGKILITEPIREFAEMLVSQVFMMEKPSDVRLEKNSTFMTPNEWEQVIMKAGASKVTVLPEDNHILNEFGQKLFIVEK